MGLASSAVLRCSSGDRMTTSNAVGEHGATVTAVEQLVGGASTASGIVFFTYGRWGAARQYRAGTPETQSGSFTQASWLRLPGLAAFRAVAASHAARTAAARWWNQNPGREDVPRQVFGLLVALVTLVILLPVCLLLLAIGRAVGASPMREVAQAACLVLLTVLMIAALARSVRRDGSAALHAAEHQVAACHAAGRRVTVEEAGAFSPVHPQCASGLVLLIALVFGGMHVALSGATDGFLPALGLRVVAAPAALLVAFVIHRASRLAPLRILALPSRWVQRWLLAEPRPADRAIAVAAYNALVDPR